jgi:lipoprotein LprG
VNTPPDYRDDGFAPKKPRRRTLYDAVMQTRLIAIFAALVAAIALIAGCSKSSEDSSKELPDAATLLQQSSETTKSQTSVHLKLTVQGEIAELPIETLEGDLTNAPAVAAQGKANLLFLGQKLDDVGFVVAEGNLFATLTAGGVYQDFGPAADIYDVSAILNPDTGLGNVLANFSDPKADGRETINGVETVRVTGNVSADAVNKIAPQIGATGPVPGTAWIREDGNHELMQAKLDTTPGNSITMTTTDWGKPVTVAKPAV